MMVEIVGQKNGMGDVQVIHKIRSKYLTLVQQLDHSDFNHESSSILQASNTNQLPLCIKNTRATRGCCSYVLYTLLQTAQVEDTTYDKQWLLLRRFVWMVF